MTGVVIAFIGVLMLFVLLKNNGLGNITTAATKIVGDVTN